MGLRSPYPKRWRGRSIAAPCPRHLARQSLALPACVRPTKTDGPKTDCPKTGWFCWPWMSRPLDGDRATKGVVSRARGPVRLASQSLGTRSQGRNRAAPVVAGTKRLVWTHHPIARMFRRDETKRKQTSIFAGAGHRRSPLPDRFWRVPSRMRSWYRACVRFFSAFFWGYRGRWSPIPRVRENRFFARPGRGSVAHRKGCRSGFGPSSPGPAWIVSDPLARPECLAWISIT